MSLRLVLLLAHSHPLKHVMPLGNRHVCCNSLGTRFQNNNPQICFVGVFLVWCVLQCCEFLEWETNELCWWGEYGAVTKGLIT